MDNVTTETLFKTDEEGNNDVPPPTAKEEETPADIAKGEPDSDSDDKEDNIGSNEPTEPKAPMISVKNGDKIDDSECLSTSSHSQRANWCNGKYEGNIGLFEECTHDFCDFCCDDKFRMIFN